ncbi:MAG: hypothetical protein ACTSQJ_19635 [Promethearchaeota archaeon]
MKFKKIKRIIPILIIVIIIELICYQIILIDDKNYSINNYNKYKKFLVNKPSPSPNIDLFKLWLLEDGQIYNEINDIVDKTNIGGHDDSTKRSITYISRRDFHGNKNMEKTNREFSKERFRRSRNYQYYKTLDKFDNNIVFRVYEDSSDNGYFNIYIIIVIVAIIISKLILDILKKKK